MAQYAGTQLRAEALCSPKDSRPRIAVEQPEPQRFPDSACLFRDTTMTPPRLLAGTRAASIEARGPYNPRTTAESCLGTQRANVTSGLKGMNSAGERQRAVAAMQHYVPLCLLSCSRMKVAQSSNAYTGSAAVGEPIRLLTGGTPTPLKLPTGR